MEKIIKTKKPNITSPTFLIFGFFSVVKPPAIYPHIDPTPIVEQLPQTGLKYQ